MLVIQVVKAQMAQKGLKLTPFEPHCLAVIYSVLSFFNAGSCIQESVTCHHLQSDLKEGIIY